MKILVIMDSYGHFQAAHPADRPAVIKLIENIQDGDYYRNMINDNGLTIKSDLAEYCCQEWNALIEEFIGRGRLEYVSLSTTIPKGCVCATK